MGRKAVIVMPQTQKVLSQMGEQIRLARLRRHLPSELVAERAGVSRQTVTAIDYECRSSDQPSLMGCLFVVALRGKNRR